MRRRTGEGDSGKAAELECKSYSIFSSWLKHSDGSHFEFYVKNGENSNECEPFNR